MELNELSALSPVDGRYWNKTNKLSAYFSEYALIKYRIIVELKYILFLKKIGIRQVQDLDENKINSLLIEAQNMSAEIAQEIKSIEKRTNHDVKAVEYWIKNKLIEKGLSPYKEFVHFGLTSQDINNTAIPISIKDAMAEAIYPSILELLEQINSLADRSGHIAMLARTHGQPATPTTMAKEIKVFSTRIKDQLPLLYAIPIRAKFGGATGNFNAHTVAYPQVDWHTAGDQFVEEYLGLKRSYPTTQIESYDMLAALAQGFSRINTILIDFCRDIWQYISMEYFQQKIVAGEVGSSTMPHKVNPIDFENAEGNLGMANALFQHLAQKLPISRLQRDLTDSTVLRNIGVPFAHMQIAYEAIMKGVNKLVLNKAKIDEDLDQNWVVLTEAIQTVMRREGIDSAYEQLKELSRGRDRISKEELHQFIDTLDLSQSIRDEMKKWTPHNYIGQVS